MKKTGITLIELVVLVVIIAIIAAIAVPNLLRSRIQSNETGNEMQNSLLDTAYRVSQEAVKDRLKSPASAKFPPIANARVNPYADGLFSVTSYVDSENSFGAMMRSDYNCAIWCRNGEWSCSRMDITQRE